MKKTKKSLINCEYCIVHIYYLKIQKAKCKIIDTNWIDSLQMLHITTSYKTNSRSLNTLTCFVVDRYHVGVVECRP